MVLFKYNSVNITLAAQFGINPIRLVMNGDNILLFNNIFDRHDVVYYSTSAEYYATPFNFMVGATYTF